MMGWEMPISWGQNFNPAFILIFGALFSILWVKLSKIGKNPSIPAKFGLALMQLGLGYGVLVVGADMAGDDYMVPLIALVLCYLLHTTGELCLSPVGLSAVTKLAPKHMTGLVMGIWFLSIASAHSVAAQIAMMTGEAGGEGSAEATLPIYVKVYDNMCWIALGVGIFACATSPFLKKWLHGAD
jgi:POT family proton-dependent oligopeptide transporter